MVIDIENQISLIEIIKGVLPSELKRFTKEYIKEHKFITLKDISYSYINTSYRFPALKIERDKILQTLVYKLCRVIPDLKKEGLIERFNGKTYKRVDKSKSENNSNSVSINH